jgi:parallel beta-helix repeat protein
MHIMPKQFSHYIEKFDKQDKKVRSAVILSAFCLLIFFALSLTLPVGNSLLHRLFPKLVGNAQSPHNIETEAGSLSGNAVVVNDSSAAGGKYVKFGTSTDEPNTTITGTAYYIDCASGLDTNDGKSESTAWKTVTKANSVSLLAGDGVLLKRGCIFNRQSLTAGWSGTAANNIIVSAYGTGNMPIIESDINGTEIIKISGNYITVENIYTRALPPARDSNCLNNPEGYILGFAIQSGARFNTIRNAKASGAWAGIDVKKGSSFNKILNNTLSDNTMMSPLDGGGQGVSGGSGDAGAFGIVLHGSDNEIAHNTISGSNACSHDYFWDGAAIEIYGDVGYEASRNSIHHNKASQSDAFSELGINTVGGKADDNIFAYNTFVSNLTDSIFLNTRGVGNSYGPVYRTKVYNNSVYLNGGYDSSRSKGPQGIVCSNCGTNILTLKNNILWADWKAIYASTAFDEGHNIYWKTGGNPVVQGFTMSTTSLKADPQYVSASSGDLHLQSSSPAIDKGTSEPGFTKDLDGKSVPNGSAIDIGGYEY